MGKYGIGARVRYRDGDLAEVIGKPEKGMREIRFLGGKLDGMTVWEPKNKLEVAEAGWQVEAGTITGVAGSEIDFGDAVMRMVSEPKFHAGQRVVAVKGYDGTFTVGNVYEVAYYQGGDYARIGVTAADHGGEDGISAPYFKPFTLEAGKFYRTRDGRKVGPAALTEWPNLDWPWTVGDAWLYQPNGVAGDGSHDNSNIVAEWVEPVVAAETIVVEDATDPVLVVVAGKRYRGRSGAEYDVVANAGNEFWPLTNDAFDRFWKEDGTAYNEGRWNEFCPAADDLVSLVTPQPKFKVGDRVDLMRDGEPVEKWSGMIVTSVGGDFYDINTDVGLPCFERELRLSPPSPRLPIGTEIILTGRVTGHNPVDPRSTNVVIDGLPAGRNSHGVSSDAISAA